MAFRMSSSAIPSTALPSCGDAEFSMPKHVMTQNSTTLRQFLETHQQNVEFYEVGYTQPAALWRALHWMAVGDYPVSPMHTVGVTVEPPAGNRQHAAISESYSASAVAHIRVSAMACHLGIANLGTHAVDKFKRAMEQLDLGDEAEETHSWLVNFLPTMVSVEMAERANKAVVSILAKATGENMHLLLENQEMDERLVRDPRFARMVLEHSGHTIGELKEQHHRSLVETASAERRLQRELTRVKQQNEVQKTKTRI